MEYFRLQVRAGVEDHGVEFQPVSAWFIDEENSVSYRLLGNAKPASGDWVGLFHNEFSSMDEYIVYEYVGRGKTNKLFHISIELYFRCIDHSNQTMNIPCQVNHHRFLSNLMRSLNGYTSVIPLFVRQECIAWFTLLNEGTRLESQVSVHRFRDTIGLLDKFSFILNEHDRLSMDCRRTVIFKLTCIQLSNFGKH